MPAKRTDKQGHEVGVGGDTAKVEGTFPEVIELDDAWIVTVEITEQHGRLVVKQMEIKLVDDDLPEGGLTSRLLRRLRLTDAVAALEDRERQARAQGGSLFPRPSRPHLLRAEERHPEIALAYLQALREDSHRPIAYVARKWRIERSTARDWKFRAARAGYLTGQSQGFARAEPTDKLRKWALDHDRDIPGEERPRRRGKR